MSKKIKKTLPDADTLAAIRFLVLDIDGVMTDGSIRYTSSGEEIKTFDVKDGTGLKYWIRAGYQVGVITGRSSPILTRIAEEVGIKYLAMDAKTKLPAFLDMLQKAGVQPEETAMIGDDLPDYPLVLRASLGVAVADAVEEVKEVADVVTKKNGGHGAVREIVEYVLKAQGRWDLIMERYLTGG